MRDRGVQAIALYKTVKGAVQIAAAAALPLFATRADHALARVIREHGAPWAVRAAALLTPGHIHLAALALLFDGLLTSVEGWALRRGHGWGPWLVVVSTSSLLPFEVISLVHHLRWTRAAALAINVAIVAYLVLRARSGAGRGLRDALRRG